MNKLTLAIDTATQRSTVAVGNGDQELAAVSIASDRRHAEVLAPAIDACVKLAGAKIGQLELIAVDVGPGLFTGLRVGVATAKALGAALGLQVVACTSLDLLAYPHRHDGRLIASVVDAKRGEVFWSLYRSAGAGPEPLGVTDPEVCEPTALAAALADLGEPVLVTGDGARRYQDRLAGQVAMAGPVGMAGPDQDHPSASSLLQMARYRPAVDADKVSPVYLRGADVRIGWDQRHG